MLNCEFVMFLRDTLYCQMNNQEHTKYVFQQVVKNFCNFNHLMNDLFFVWNNSYFGLTWLIIIVLNLHKQLKWWQQQECFFIPNRESYIYKSFPYICYSFSIVLPYTIFMHVYIHIYHYYYIIVYYYYDYI